MTGDMEVNQTIPLCVDDGMLMVWGEKQDINTYQDDCFAPKGSEATLKWLTKVNLGEDDDQRSHRKCYNQNVYFCAISLKLLQWE